MKIKSLKEKIVVIRESQTKFIAEHPAVSAPTLIPPRHQKPASTPNIETGNTGMNDDFSRIKEKLKSDLSSSTNQSRGFFNGATPEEMEKLQKNETAIKKECPSKNSNEKT